MKQFKAGKRKDLRKTLRFMIIYYALVTIGVIVMYFLKPSWSIHDPDLYKYALLVFSMAIYFGYSIRNLQQKISTDESYILTIDDNTIKREVNGLSNRSISKSDIKSIKKNTIGAFTIYGSGDNYIYVPTFVDELNEALEELVQIKPLDEKVESYKIEFENENESFISFLQRHLQSNKPNFVGIAVSTTGIILISLIHLYFYFNLYGVKIHNYLEVQEIVLAFMSIWKECLLTLVFFAIFLWRWEGLSLKIATGKRPTHITVLFTIQFLFVVCAILLMIYMGAMMVPNVKEPTFNGEILFFVFVVSMFCIMPLFWLTIMTYFMNLFLYSSEKPVSALHTYVAAIIFAISLIFFENYLSYKLLINGYPKFDVKLYGNDKKTIMETSSQVVYIGETKAFLFFYDVDSKKCTAINRSSVGIEERIILRRGL